MLLCNVNEALGLLKAIFLDIENNPSLLAIQLLAQQDSPSSISSIDESASGKKHREAYQDLHCRRFYELAKCRLKLCLQLLNKCLLDLFPNFYQYPIVSDPASAERVLTLINVDRCYLNTFQDTSLQDVSTLYFSFEDAVEHLIHVSRKEVRLHCSLFFVHAL